MIRNCSKMSLESLKLHFWDQDFPRWAWKFYNSIFEICIFAKMSLEILKLDFWDLKFFQDELGNSETRFLRSEFFPRWAWKFWNSIFGSGIFPRWAWKFWNSIFEIWFFSKMSLEILTLHFWDLKMSLEILKLHENQRINTPDNSKTPGKRRFTV